MWPCICPKRNCRFLCQYAAAKAIQRYQLQPRIYSFYPKSATFYLSLEVLLPPSRILWNVANKLIHSTLTLTMLRPAIIAYDSYVTTPVYPSLKTRWTTLTLRTTWMTLTQMTGAMVWTCCISLDPENDPLPSLWNARKFLTNALLLLASWFTTIPKSHLFWPPPRSWKACRLGPAVLASQPLVWTQI
jgi:hypothetical protein